MFASLKNKIKEETGTELSPHQRLNYNNNNQVTTRANSIDGSDQFSVLRSQCNELTTKVTDLTSRLATLQAEKLNVEKTNEILLETVKVAQSQKDIYCEEQEKIQNVQRTEIDKLKSLLSFREQEAVDRISALRQSQQQIENLTSELERVKQFEHAVEDLQDELESLRHSSEQEKNNLSRTLARLEEENQHLRKKLTIIEQSRVNVLSSLKADQKVQALIQERKLLEQHLEEAHLQLSDIKSSWSGQNLALETQVSRLSKQVAEETTEKRKILKISDDLAEKVKHLEFEMVKLESEIQKRDDKIKLLEEELDEVNQSLKECREESEQQIVFERNRASTLAEETNRLNARIEAADSRFTEYATNAENTSQSMRQQIAQMQCHLAELQNELEHEKEEKLSALLRNAEISQSEEILKKDLRVEREENVEWNEKYIDLEASFKEKEHEINSLKLALEEKTAMISKNEDLIKDTEEIRSELFEKNKAIRILNQNITDLKKTLQMEFINSKPFEGPFKSARQTPTILANTCTVCAKNGASTSVIVMDEVNFKYLKHVIVKFLTSREVEARHLLRAVSTLLSLTKEEETVLYDTLNWKMSWFGSKPNHGSGQHAFSIPPS